MSALGELETLILLAILRLGETYGVPVRDEIENRAGKRLTRGAVYTALARLEKKGYLDSTIGPPTPVRGKTGSICRGSERSILSQQTTVVAMVRQQTPGCVFIYDKL